MCTCATSKGQSDLSAGRMCSCSSRSVRVVQCLPIFVACPLSLSFLSQLQVEKESAPDTSTMYMYIVHIQVYKTCTQVLQVHSTRYSHIAHDVLVLCTRTEHTYKVPRTSYLVHMYLYLVRCTVCIGTYMYMRYIIDLRVVYYVPIRPRERLAVA